MFSGSIISQIKKLAEEYSQRDDQYLAGVALDLGFESRQSDDITPLLPRGFALVQVAAKRQLGMQHYDCQLQGGYVMCRGNIAEMRTGEGKTLTATLPMFVHALAGRGALLATSNDYLAERDAHEMAPLYRSLGLSVGVIQQSMSREQRRAAYGCHITYGTMSEFGFDFLKDHSKQREQKQRELWYGAAGGVAESPDSKPVHRDPHFLLIDEADSILIDDARTPLIISAPADSSAQQQQQTLYAWTAKHTDQYIEDDHYWYDREKRSVDLTPDGTALVRAISKPAELAGVGLLEMYDFVERAIQVARDFKMDRDYVIRDGEIVIVDESTGRIAEGRRWSRGIHQAIEAKEQVEITADTSTAAKITVQSFVSRFPFIAGMTGTAYTSRKEFKKIYHTGVEVIPTNKPSQRIENPVKFFHTEAEKFQQVVLDVAEIHDDGQADFDWYSVHRQVRTVIDPCCVNAGVEHEVLNAREVEREAQIVESAGEFARVTVATNMAGRGTDIKINAHVCELGGMHVIGTEMHDSSRIDQQLFGRCGRQGDPGSVQLYIAAEDKLLESAFGRQTAQKYRRTGRTRIASYWIALFNKAQQKLENQHYRSRRILMHSEKQMSKAQREMGLDPILDNFD